MDGSFPDCLLLSFCHGISMALYPDCLDLPDASDSIGTKHKSDDLGNEVIVFSALLWIIKISAISARRITTLHATGPDLAPRSLPIVMTPGTTSFQVRTTRTTVKTTICHHGYIRSDSLHRLHSPMPKLLLEVGRTISSSTLTLLVVHTISWPSRLSLLSFIMPAYIIRLVIRLKSPSRHIADSQQH